MTIGLNTMQINAGVQKIITILEEEKTDITVISKNSLQNTIQSSETTVQIKIMGNLTIDKVC